MLVAVSTAILATIRFLTVVTLCVMGSLGRLVLFSIFVIVVFLSLCVSHCFFFRLFTHSIVVHERLNPDSLLHCDGYRLLRVLHLSVDSSGLLLRCHQRQRLCLVLSLSLAQKWRNLLGLDGSQDTTGPASHQVLEERVWVWLELVEDEGVADNVLLEPALLSLDQAVDDLVERGL